MQKQDFLVTYEDSLQGKTHRVVIKAMSDVDAWNKVVKDYAWQAPNILKVTPYSQPKLI